MEVDDVKRCLVVYGWKLLHNGNVGDCSSRLHLLDVYADDAGIMHVWYFEN